MAKRAAPDEKPYRPLLDAELVSAAISRTMMGERTDITASRPATSQRDDRSSRNILPLHRQQPPAGDESQVNPAQVEKFLHEKRILFTRRESQELDRLVVALAARLNAQLKVSHVMRALVALLLNAQSEIDRRAGEVGPLVRPANGDAQALQSFEREISRIIMVGLRDGPTLR